MDYAYRILAVDDEPDILRTNRRYLEAQGYQVDTAACASDALEYLKKQNYDAILLDVLLPDRNGFALCEAIRALTSAPILFLSCMDEEEDKIKGLMAGGDDYITKPFGTSELLARIRTSLRHSNKMNTDSPMFIKPYHAKDLTIDFSKRLILLHEQEIHLTPIEYKIVACLAKNSGKVVTYSSIMSDVWGPYTDTDNKILRVNMANIRRKLETNPAEPTYIFTELGVAYRMKEDESE